MAGKKEYRDLTVGELYRNGKTVPMLGVSGLWLKLPKTICNKYFEGMNSKQMASVAEQALAAWFEGKETAVV